MKREELEQLRALEAFIDAKIAFAKMEPEVRQIYIPALDAKRNKLAAALRSKDPTP